MVEPEYLFFLYFTLRKCNYKIQNTMRYIVIFVGKFAFKMDYYIHLKKSKASFIFVDDLSDDFLYMVNLLMKYKKCKTSLFFFYNKKLVTSDQIIISRTDALKTRFESDNLTEITKDCHVRLNSKGLIDEDYIKKLYKKLYIIHAIIGDKSESSVYNFLYNFHAYSISHT